MDRQILVSLDLLRRAAQQLESDALGEYGYTDPEKMALAVALRLAIEKATT